MQNAIKLLGSASLAVIATSAPMYALTQNPLEKEFAMFSAGGIEMGAAGFHLVYTPVADPQTISRAFPHPGEYCVRQWCFWDAKPKYSRAYSSFEASLNQVSRRVPVSFDALVDNAVFQYAIVHNPSEGNYEVHGTVNSFGLGLLGGLLAPAQVDPSTGDVTDWYGIRRPASAEETEMRLAVVSEDLAYTPFSVTNILDEVGSQGLSEYTVVLADDLSLADAETLLSRLHGFKVGDPFCYPADNNATGFPAVMTGFFGSGVGSDLHLEATQGVPGQFGYFLVGTGVSEPGIAISEGHLCLAVGTDIFGRYNVIGGTLNSVGQFDASGVLQNQSNTSATGAGYDVPLDLPQPIGGTILVGSEWHFQLWYRNDNTGISNFSNGLSVTFM